MPNDLAREFHLGEINLEAFSLTGEKRLLAEAINHLIRVYNDLKT